MPVTLEKLLDPLLLGVLVASFGFLWVIWKLLREPADAGPAMRPGSGVNEVSLAEAGDREGERPPAGPASRMDRRDEP